MKKDMMFLAAGLFILPVFSQAACHVPTTLAGKTLVNKTDPQWSKQNPNADSMLRLEFSEKNYVSHFLKTGGKAEGTYTYQVHESKQDIPYSIGVMKAKENFGGEITEYTVTFVCLNNVSGTIVFNQHKGAIKPDVRQNTGTYTVQ